MEDNQKEEFKALAVAMKPIIEEMWAVLKEHKVKDIASLALDADGYARFCCHNNDWEMLRCTGDTKFFIRNETREEI